MSTTSSSQRGASINIPSDFDSQASTDNLPGSRPVTGINMYFTPQYSPEDIYRSSNLPSSDSLNGDDFIFFEEIENQYMGIQNILDSVKRDYSFLSDSLNEIQIEHEKSWCHYISHITTESIIKKFSQDAKDRRIQLKEICSFIPNSEPSPSQSCKCKCKFSDITNSKFESESESESESERSNNLDKSYFFSKDLSSTIDKSNLSKMSRDESEWFHEPNQYWKGLEIRLNRMFSD
ncbi:uncharacterized protein L201_007474 [Kwoniella dendrophila CBS 6074]|uniref:Uncharacterized protein n=1 Tax=Kwoniella dendrophila CBS 6074 TaxID=1295534 RepID=A0AAX4K4H4_9TREE